MNTFGDKFSFTSFGESHGVAIGGVLDGVPAGIRIDIDLIHHELDRRAGRLTTAPVSKRAEAEPNQLEWLSGVLDGVTLGTPIAFLIRNRDARPEDYAWLKDHYRMGHADLTYMQKYGIRDWRGGGRASARETASRVVAGCIAKQLLRRRGITIEAELVQVGTCTDPQQFDETIRRVQAAGDSIGGIVRCTITGVPAGIGEPIFDKLQAHLAFAVMSINACKGFDYGTGFAGVGLCGSEANAVSGGIAGGIADGSPIVFRCVFKPTPSISKPTSPSHSKTISKTASKITPKIPSKPTICLTTPEPTLINGGIPGRHDPCVAVRAVPVVEAMSALTLINFLP